MFCNTCGAPLNGTETVCPVCGAQLTPVNAQPQAVEPDTQPAQTTEPNAQPSQVVEPPQPETPSAEQPQASAPQQANPYVQPGMMPQQPTQPIQPGMMPQQPQQPMQPGFAPNRMPPGSNLPTMQPGLPPHQEEYLPDGSVIRRRDAPPQKKKHTGVLVAVIVAIVAALGVGGFFLVRFLTKDKEETTTEAATDKPAFTTEAMITTEETTTEATTETTTEATTTEAPKPKTYLEEHGIVETSLDEQPFVLPARQWVMDYDQKNYLSEDVARGLPNPWTATFGEMTKSEPDENGYVTVTIPITQKHSSQVITASRDASFYSGYYRWTFDFFDAYTGKMIEWSDYNSEKNDYDIKYTNVEWEGRTYTISARMEDVDDNSDEYFNYIGEAEGGYLFEMNIEKTSNMIVTMPYDYDGLCLVNYEDLVDDSYYEALKKLYGQDEPEVATALSPTTSTDITANHIMDDITIGDWTKPVASTEVILIKVNDYLK